MAYNPASTVSSDPNLAHISNVVHYDRVAVKNLKQHLPFYHAIETRSLPKGNGKVIQLFSRVPFSYNVTPASEGVVGAGLTYTTVRQQATLSQYVDYISFSDFILEISISRELEDEAKELGYRSALTLNKIIQTQIDTTAAADATTNIDLTAGSANMDASVSRRASMSMAGANVKPKSSGYFAGIIHPFMAFDMINDNTAGGLIDFEKRDSGSSAYERGISGHRVVRHYGVDWILTTTVGTTSNYQSGGNTGYHAYVLGEDAFIGVDLGKMDVPEDENNFKLMIKRYDGASVADPANVIGGTVGYNFKFAITPPPGQPTTIVNRFRRIRAEASIS